MEFRILGPLEVLDEGRRVRISGAKERALLAILLLDANQLVSSDRLIDELWGADPPGTARKSLQVRVSGLRKALRDGVLVTRGVGYSIQLDPDELDLNRFERLVEQGRQALADARPSPAARHLHEALSLWRGPALADFAYESFAQPATARLEELRLAALELRIEADLACGRHAEVIAELEGLAAEHPLRERLRGQLMLALYRCGRQAEALEVYRRTRRTLVDELGMEPTPALQELEQAILRQDATLDLAGGPAPVRSILVVALEETSVASLLGVGEILALRPRRELILACLVDPGELGRANAFLNERREALLERRVAARTAVFASPDPGRDVVRLAVEQDVDLLLVAAQAETLDDVVARYLLEAAPCDVALLVRGEKAWARGAVLVPFAGAEHDWSAVELAAWIAGAAGVPLRLAGPIWQERDASRLLASASLAVQRALGIAAEPVLVERGPEGLLGAAEDAGLVVVGLSDRWRKEGIGTTRLALVTNARPPVLLVRRGLRPGGLAPKESLTRYTWSLGTATV